MRRIGYTRCNGDRCNRLIYRHVDSVDLICDICLERKNMVQTKQLKITAEVDGKQVPLENISTETFEAIKALEKSKEIRFPVAAVGHFKGDPGDRRLFLKISENLRNVIANPNVHTVAIELERSDHVNNYWLKDNSRRKILGGDQYENIQPL